MATDMALADTAWVDTAWEATAWEATAWAGSDTAIPAWATATGMAIREFMEEVTCRRCTGSV